MGLQSQEKTSCWSHLSGGRKEPASPKGSTGCKEGVADLEKGFDRVDRDAACKRVQKIAGELRYALVFKKLCEGTCHMVRDGGGRIRRMTITRN